MSAGLACWSFLFVIAVVFQPSRVNDCESLLWRFMTLYMTAYLNSLMGALLIASVFHDTALKIIPSYIVCMTATTAAKGCLIVYWWLFGRMMFWMFALWWNVFMVGRNRLDVRGFAWLPRIFRNDAFYGICNLRLLIGCDDRLFHMAVEGYLMITYKCQLELCI